MRKFSSLFFFLLVFFQSQTVLAQLPDGFYDEVVVDNFDPFVGIVFDETGRGFTWRRTGEVFLLDTNEVLSPDPVVDISEEVASWWDMGMLGFALDPKFLDNGQVYLFYVVDRHHLIYHGTPEYDPNVTTTDKATIGRITSFVLDKTNDFKTVVPNSRKVIIGATKETGFPMLFKTHGTGSLAFGADGTLLASCGDTGHPDWVDVGGSAETYHAQALADGIMREEENVGTFRSQLLNSLSGKIIRIDPETGEGVPSNPFYDPAAPDSPRSKVWSLGLRNPYRFIVRPNTGSHFSDDGDPGELVIGDVGSNFWEEINIATAGGQNFGWPMYEGFERKQNYISRNTENKDAPNPLFNNGNCEEEFFLFSDLLLPPSLPGTFLFKNPCDTTQLIPENIPTFVHERPVMAYRNEDDNTFPDVVFPEFDINGHPINISITDPEANVQGEPFVGITSMGGLFYQGDNFPEEYKGIYFHPDYKGWIRTIEFDENNEPRKIDVFSNSTGYIVTLSENPKNGCLYYINIKNMQLRKICYGGTPAPVANAQADKYFGASPLLVQFDASESFSPAESPLNYSWDFGDGTISDEMEPSHTFISLNGVPSYFTVKLTVTDTAGQARTDQVIISLNNTPPTASIQNLPDSSFYFLDRTTLIQLNGSAIDAEHSDEELVYEWRTYLEHNTHEHIDLIEEAKNTFFYISPLGCEDEEYSYRVELKVTDGAGLSDTDTAFVFPYCENDLFELSFFNAEKNNRTVQLNWEMVFENNISYFEIERGNSIFDFKAIWKIYPNNLSEYSLTDFYPLTGANFYRLKIWQDQNVFHYSTPVMVDFAVEGDDILLYPNPAKNLINVSIKNTYAEKINFKLYQLNGALVFKTNWPVELNAYFNEQLFLPNLPQGIYFYEIKNGEELKRGGVVIN
ncbi:MAG: PQQ-dependent sugar dehydrogenase [Bacteroidota bacterium]